MPELLALFARSLRADTRSKSLLWTRIALGVGVLYAFFNSGLSGRWRYYNPAPGLTFFTSLVWINFAAILVGGMSYFATAITEEKEEGTLSLLRMTNLSPFAILLGKSTSRFCGGLLLLAVQVPFAVLAVSLGGIHLLQIFKSYALLAALLFFACNAGLLGSVLAPRTGFAGLVAGLLGWGCWALFEVLGEVHRGRFGLLRLPSVLGGVLRLGGQDFPIGPACLAALVLGLLAFLASRLSFERFCGETAIPLAAGARRGFARLASLWRPRAGRAWQHAVTWKDFHHLHGGNKLLAIKSIAYLAVAIGIFTDRVAGRSWAHSSEEFFPIICLLSFLMLFAESLFAASRIFRLERRDRTLAALVLLPETLDALLLAKRRAVILSLIPLLALFGISLLPVSALALPLIFWNGSATVFSIGLIGCIVLEFYLHCYLVAWFSLRLRWGGLPVALALSFVANTIAIPFFGLMFREACTVILCIPLVCIILPLRSALHRRLLGAAEEE